MFLDESGVSTDMTRHYGRSPRGERVFGSVPQGHWKTFTLLAGVRLRGPLAPLIIDGPLDGPMFLEWTRRFLVPELHAGNVVILDNLRTHAVAGFKEMVNAVGAQVRYLPPYSPDLNPIENMWSKVKAFFRSMEARTYEALLDAMAKALRSITEEDCMGFFGHSGYVYTVT